VAAAAASGGGASPTRRGEWWGAGISVCPPRSKARRSAGRPPQRGSRK
jgi:hypothetical protein